jgi:CheY-like chemotaxis protein
MPQTNFNVVAVGNNRELLLLRDAVLRSAGFDVFTTENESEALARVSRGDCGVLLVCYSTPLPIKRHLAVAYRKQCPEGRIIAVANQAVETLEVADSLVYGIEGPEGLIDAIRGNLEKSNRDALPTLRVND